MPLRRLLVWLIGLAAMAALYHGLVTLAVMWLWMPPPDWWSLPISKKAAALTWLQLVHGVALAAAALPCALLLHRLPGRRPVVSGLVVAGIALVAPALWSSVSYLPSFSTFMRVSFGLDLLKFALVLPAIVWLLARARVRGPRAAQA